MLTPKHCHRGLRQRSTLFGLEPADSLLLGPPLIVCVLLKAPLLGIASVFGLGVILRILKWDRPAGYTLALVNFMVHASDLAACGHDRVRVAGSGWLLAIGGQPEKRPHRWHPEHSNGASAPAGDLGPSQHLTTEGQQR